jgi:Nuclease-related domain
MDLRLHRDLINSETILNDRQVPGGVGNIDHVVVASSGVWVIDTKYWEGGVEYRGASGVFDANPRLFFNGEDCTYLADEIYAQVIPIAEILNDRSIPIRPALVFINADWKSTLRVVTNKPYRHNDVLIAWPKALISQIQVSGPLDVTQMSAIGSYLGEQLRPM